MTGKVAVDPLRSPCPPASAELVRGAVAVQNYGSSGTLFLQSLLDGHPQLLTVPALYMRDFYTFWERAGVVTAPQIVDAFLSAHRYWFNPAGAVRAHGLQQMGTARDRAVWVPEEPFRAALTRALDRWERPSRRVVLVSLYLAYAEALGRAVRRPATVVFPLHSLPRRHARSLVEDLPNTKFLHVVREPVQSIGSLVKHIIHEQLPVNPFECALAQLLNDYMKHWGRAEARYVHGDRPLFPDCADASRAIRLEDLHRTPRQTLRALCRWLDIEWDDCLLESTFDGLTWWNRPGSVRTTGFGTTTIDQRHPELLNSFDRFRLAVVARRKAAAWGYDAPAATAPLRAVAIATLVLPFRAETVGVRGLPRRLRYGVDWTVKRIARLARRLGSEGSVGPMGGRARLARLVRGLVAGAVLPAAVGVLLRDYVMIRWWLYRAWIVGLVTPTGEVKVLTPAVIGAPDPGEPPQ